MRSGISSLLLSVVFSLVIGVVTAGDITAQAVDVHEMVLVGPKDDPAAIKGSPGVLAALQWIQIRQAAFISADENAGSRERESALWRKTGIEPEGQQWYIRLGKNSAESLAAAAKLRAYTLVERGDFDAKGDSGVLGIIATGN